MVPPMRVKHTDLEPGQTTDPIKSMVTSELTPSHQAKKRKSPSTVMTQHLPRSQDQEVEDKPT